MTAPGWYHAEGDPVGTTRYWDGEIWVGDPVPTPPPGQPTAPGSAGAYGAPSMPGAGGYVDPTATGPGYVLASPGQRIGARLIDFIIGLVLAGILLVPFITGIIDDIDALGPDPDPDLVSDVIENAATDSAGVFIGIGAIGLFWDFLWVGLLGATPGKLLLGLRVANPASGISPPGWGKAALRSLNRLAGFIPGIGPLIAPLIGLASLIMLFTDDQNRTVMDRIATTVVIKK